jgi:flagellin
MSIKTNVASLNAQRNLFSTNMQLDSSLSKLSSGYRITKAGDDAAGLGISSNLEAQIRSYNQAARNAQDGMSLIQTAEGALNETTNLLARLRELAMQAGSDGVGDTERGYINDEASQITTEIERIATGTEFNGTMLLDGVAADPLSFQIGIREDATSNAITVDVGDATLDGLGLTADMGLDTRDGALAALTVIDDAIQSVSGVRATFGAVGNRLTSVVSTIQTASENLSAANSRIRDVDVAEETSKMARAQVLMQAGVSVLAQANQQPQLALKLLG